MQAQTIELRDGTHLETGTCSECDGGAGGAISLLASDSIVLAGVGHDGNGVTVQTRTAAGKNGGGITLTAGTALYADAAEVSSITTATGDAGSVILEAQHVQLENGTQLRSETGIGRGGPGQGGGTGSGGGGSGSGGSGGGMRSGGGSGGGGSGGGGSGGGVAAEAAAEVAAMAAVAVAAVAAAAEVAVVAEATAVAVAVTVAAAGMVANNWLVGGETLSSAPSRALPCARRSMQVQTPTRQVTPVTCTSRRQLFRYWMAPGSAVMPTRAETAAALPL